MKSWEGLSDSVDLGITISLFLSKLDFYATRFWADCVKFVPRALRIRAMHEANTALLDILVDNSVIIKLIGLSWAKCKALHYFSSANKLAATSHRVFTSTLGCLH